MKQHLVVLMFAFLVLTIEIGLPVLITLLLLRWLGVV